MNKNELYELEGFSSPVGYARRRLQHEVSEDKCFKEFLERRSHGNQEKSS